MLVVAAALLVCNSPVLGLMAKRYDWTALWLLVFALLARAETSHGQTANSPQRLAPADNQRDPHAARYATTNRAQVEDPTAAYQVSGEAYAAIPSPREVDHRTKAHSSVVRRGTYNAAAQREIELARREEELYGPAPSIDDEAGLIAEGYGPEGFAAERFEDQLYGEDAWEEPHEGHREPHHHSGKLRHFFGSFFPEHGTFFRTSKNSPRSIGMGEPLKGTSWQNRPNSISFFVGMLNGDELIANRVDQGSALFGGLRLGWDFDPYWGLEVRAGWSSPTVEFDPPPTDQRVDGIFLLDASFLYYPWGDSSWRPYGLLGMGMARFDFTDETGLVHDEYLLGIPIGLGMKYMYHPNLIFRAEFLNNIACASSGLENMNNLSFSLGMEVRFGGSPRSYYPWQPAKYIW